MLEAWQERIRNELYGGGDVAWERSIKGRIYDVRQTLLAADNLAQAVREVRRERARQWSRWEKGALFVFAGATALASLIGAAAAVVALLG